MHGDSGRRLHVHVSCWLPADAGALHACGIGSVAGAASSVRGDGISDERADLGTDSQSDLSANSSAYSQPHISADSGADCRADHSPYHASLRCRHALVLAQHD